MAHGPKHYGLYTPQGSTVHEEMPVMRALTLAWGAWPCQWPDPVRVNPQEPEYRTRAPSVKTGAIAPGPASESWSPSYPSQSASIVGLRPAPTRSDAGAQSP